MKIRSFRVLYCIFLINQPIGALASNDSIVKCAHYTADAYNLSITLYGYGRVSKKEKDALEIVMKRFWDFAYKRVDHGLLLTDDFYAGLSLRELIEKYDVDSAFSVLQGRVLECLYKYDLFQ